MKKIDALKAFDAWLKDIKEDLILEELFCSIRSDERLESLKALRKELLFSDSPLRVCRPCSPEFCSRCDAMQEKPERISTY